MNTTLLRLLNIKPSEAWLVRNLFFLQLFQSIGIAMLLTLSNALFLAQFDVDELPKVYVLSGLILLLVNYVYAKLEHKLPMQQLILYILMISALSILFIRILIYSFEYSYAPVLLLIWYQVVYLLCGNSFWGLASQVFDVRESKRTFSILSAGDTPAKLLGYLSISAFAGTIDIKNFLFISVICFFISYLFMQHIIRSKRVDFKHMAEHTQHHEKVQTLKTPGPMEVIRSFIGNNLILLISIVSFIVVASLTVIDFTFLSDVKLKFKKDVALLEFLGAFLAAGRIFAILAKIMLTSRIERQLGIKKSLLILPVLLIAFTLFVLISKRMEGDYTFYLYVFGTMVVLTEVLKSVLQDPLILVLFQPLQPLLRLKGHVISKGIFAPLGLLFAGAFISLSIYFSGTLNISTTCLLLLLMCSAWIAVVYLLDRQYMTTLIQSLKTGFFRGNFLLSNDSAVRKLLMDKLKSPKPLEVIYAADSLEKLDKDSIRQFIPILIHHESDAVKEYALRKAVEHRVVSVIPDVEAMLNGNVSDDLRSECLNTLSSLKEDPTGIFLEYLDHPNIQLQQQAMIALFTSGDIDAIIIAGKKLIDWMNSDDERYRILAAATIGKAADKNFYTSLTKLLNDPSEAVQKKAIEAAGEIKSNRLIPVLLEKLHQPGMSGISIKALAACGEEVFQYLPPPEQLKTTALKPVQRYVKIAGRAPSQKAKEFLENLLFTDVRLKTTIIKTMKDISYKAPPEKIEALKTLLFSEIDMAYGIIDYLNDLNGDHRLKVLQDALYTELKTCEANVFYLLSFIYNRQKLLQAYENIQFEKTENLANAIEILDIEISRRIGTRFIPIVEFLHERKAKTVAAESNAVEKLDIIKKIIDSTTYTFNSWTTAAAIYFMNQLNHKASVDFLSGHATNGDYLVEETRNFVLSNP